MKRLLALLLLQAILIAAVGCGTETSAPGFFLASIVEIDLEGGESGKAKQEIVRFLDDFEAKVAVDAEGSDVWNINRAKAGEAVAVCDWTADLLAEAKALYDETNGVFDPALLPLTELWGFSPAFEGSYSVPRPEPAAEAIQAALAVSDLSLFTLEGNTVVKAADGAALDFGGIAKGYAMDRARNIAERYGAVRGTVSMGSSIAVLGEKAGGAAYTIGLRDPRGLPGQSFAAVKVRDTAIAVSGDYERFYEYEGKRYCHILDAATGRPAESGMLTVAVVGRSASRADALSTAAFVLGQERAAALLKRLGVSAVLVFEHEGKRWYRTTGEIEFTKDSEGKDNVYREYAPWTEGRN